MNKERLEMFKTFVGLGISPLLIPKLPTDMFENAVVVNSNIAREELTGHYEGEKYCPPKWYSELVEKSDDKNSLLIIKDINEIDVKEQTKFIEILKYKKVSTFEFPDNTLIIVTCTDLSNKKIAEDVYSLLAQI